MLEVREARYFVAVAEELHFGRAAERLHMSQPPLSQAIKSLERRLGAQLLVRSTRAVALTAAGEVFLRHCRGLVNAAQEADEAARQAAEGQLGLLRIGAVTSAFFDPLPGMLTAFRSAHPRVEVVLQELDTHDALRALAEHAIDVALVRLLATPPGFQRRILVDEEFLVAAPGSWQLGEPPLDLGSVAARPWIWLPRQVSPDYHDKVVQCCRDSGFSPIVSNTAHSIVSQLAMVSCGIGVALVPASTAVQVRSPGDRVQFLRIKRAATIQTSAVWSRQISAAVEAFLSYAPVVSMPSVG
ncbi:MAG TPA: LysR substrate-binding domain-containing protein [Candidatus Nanopelagicales bacterium]|nr:LysR substrate-binding domain-containing protein [Candidatus Nanopelagicales bacterium]